MLINKRMKSYAICLKSMDDEILAIADYPVRLEPAKTYCHLWSSPPTDCLRFYKKKYPTYNVFITRIGSKSSPIEIDWDKRCYRWPTNRTFKLKEPM